MHPVRKRRLIGLLGLLILLSAVVWLILYAMRQNISLFYTPTQIYEGKASAKALIRVGGMVVPGTVHRDKSGRRVTFNVSDFNHELKVEYEGVLPDLFREKQGVVVNGRLSSSSKEATILATEVLAKHDANYMPPEIRNMKINRIAKHVG